MLKRRWQWLALVGFSLVLKACGVDEDSQYPSGKQFVGRTQQPHENSADVTVAKEEAEVSPAVVERNASSEESTENETTEIDPNEVVLSNHFRAKFDVGTALKLVDGRDPSDSLGLARSTIEDRLNSVTDKDGIRVSQSYGDGKSRSKGTQIIVNTPGDAALEEGQISNSGLQSYDRVTDDPGCPAAFVCIDRLTFEPTVGEPMTVCYSDASGKTIAVPYAIPPTTKLADVPDIAKIYGPFTASSYRASSMDCSQPTVEPEVVEIFTTEVKAGAQPGPSSTRLFQRPDALRFDYEVVMVNRRVNDDNQAPYLDETVKLQMQTVYVFDSEKSVLAKMIKTVRSSVKLPFPVNLIMRMDGLQVDLHFELCENLLDQTNFCTP